MSASLLISHPCLKSTFLLSRIWRDSRRPLTSIFIFIRQENVSFGLMSSLRLQNTNESRIWLNRVCGLFASKRLLPQIFDSWRVHRLSDKPFVFPECLDDNGWLFIDATSRKTGFPPHNPSQFSESPQKRADQSAIFYFIFLSASSPRLPTSPSNPTQDIPLLPFRFPLVPN